MGQSGRGAREIAIQAVLEAGRLVRRRFRHLKGYHYKGRRNPVTEVDLAAEEMVVGLLRREFPQHALLAEEGSRTTVRSDYLWLLDPLDGTRNYAQGVPFVAISLALARADTVLLGVLYDPLHRELFWAERGQGAFLGKKRLAVSQKTSLSEAVMGFDLGYEDEPAGVALSSAQALWPGVQSLRVLGSAALGLAYTAAGRFDLYFHNCVSPWDTAAGSLLCTEAGGLITRRDGSPWTLQSQDFIAANAPLHAQFRSFLEGVG